MQVTSILNFDHSTALERPLFLSQVPAGFPSPAEDYVEQKLDLNRHLIRHPAATYFVRVAGDSMIEAGIHSGDLLIVDRSLEPQDRNVVIAVLNGELTVKRFRRIKEKIFLFPENPQYAPIEIPEGSHLEIWGVVTTVIHSLLKT